MATTDNSPTRKWLARIGWLLLIWAASIAALAVVSWGLRVIMNAVGLTA
jgi:hypothetical protein